MRGFHFAAHDGQSLLHRRNQFVAKVAHFRPMPMEIGIHVFANAM
jgi:hypothetical protein